MLTLNLTLTCVCQLVSSSIKEGFFSLQLLYSKNYQRSGEVKKCNISRKVFSTIFCYGFFHFEQESGIAVAS